MGLKNYRTAKTFRDVFADDLSNPELGFEYLMELHDELFVEEAYRLLFRREADSSGIRYYVGRLRRGYSRISTLHQLVQSREVRADWQKIGGLEEELCRYRRSRSVRGWRLALSDPELGRTPAKRQERILQNGLGAQRQLLTRATESIQAEVAGSVNHGQSRAQSDEHDGERRAHRSWGRRFQPPRPRTISEIRESDLPDRVRAAVRLLDF